VLEDRGAGKLVLEAHLPDGGADAAASPWTMPAEWEGAVDVTDDPAWGRAVLTAVQWPEPEIRPRSPAALARGTNAWGALRAT
jgi:hypothetical protein